MTKYIQDKQNVYMQATEMGRLRTDLILIASSESIASKVVSAFNCCNELLINTTVADTGLSDARYLAMEAVK